MKITKVAELHEFLSAVSQAKGSVYLRSMVGDCYNLKSELSKYVAIGALLGEHGDELELFCDESADEPLFFKFFKNYPEVLD